MTSRERVIAAINHQQPDRVPIDFGATGQSGISVSALYRLREYYGLEKKPLDVYETMQMIGVIDEDMRQVVKADVVSVNFPHNSLGVKNGESKIFHMPDGTPTYIAQGNEYDVLEDGSIVMYPQGNRSFGPSVYMPSGGYFFDMIDRAPKIDEDNLTPREDFKNYFSIISDENLRFVENQTNDLYKNTQYAIIGNLACANLGDAGCLPAPFELEPKGIRKFEDWCMAQVLYPEYIKEVFEMQVEYALKNLQLYKQAVGDKIQIVTVSGTDFGTQNAAFISVDMFRELYKPYYKRVNDWIHQNTNWKTFYHSCGSVVSLLDEFIDMGVDILNPVQTSAKDMNPSMLKEKYGDKLTFWGGGIDTQNILPNGSVDEIHKHVQENLSIFSNNGGYVFNTVHNIQGNTKAENIAAAFNAVHEFNKMR